VVQAVENLTSITGRVLAREPHPRLAGWDLVVVHVDVTRPVAGKADLLGRHEGQDLAVAFRRELLADAGPGWSLAFRARFSLDGAIAEPYPDPGDLIVRSPGA
jgi:hypothetical protein